MHIAEQSLCSLAICNTHAGCFQEHVPSQSLACQCVTTPRTQLARKLRSILQVNIGLTVSNGRMSPCFPGVDLWILGSGNDIEEKHVVNTRNWQALGWGQELMRRNVTTLLCAGVDRFCWGALQGYGIEVVPVAVGSPNQVLEQWRNGELTPPDMCPSRRQVGYGRACRRGRRRRGSR